MPRKTETSSTRERARRIDARKLFAQLPKPKPLAPVTAVVHAPAARELP
jgi:hypothetical protein